MFALDYGDGDRVKYTYDDLGRGTRQTYEDGSNPPGATGNHPPGASNPLRYRGYVYDKEYEFYYLQSRYYNPEVGRFLNADALSSTGQGFSGNNMFAYVVITHPLELMPVEQGRIIFGP